MQFAHELPLIFALTAASTVVLAVAIRTLFRRGLGVTDLERIPTRSPRSRSPRGGGLARFR